MSENDRAQRNTRHKTDEGPAAQNVAPPDDATLEEAVDVEALQAELAKERDHALRSQAELENFRKRAARQMDEERRYANLPLLRDLLHVWTTT